MKNERIGEFFILPYILIIIIFWITRQDNGQTKIFSS